MGLSELLREGDKDKDSDSGVSAAMPLNDDDDVAEEEEDDIRLPSPKISISAGSGAREHEAQGQREDGEGGDGDSEPPSLPTSLQSTPKAASAQAMKVGDILHPSQALEIGGQTAKDLKGLDKLLAKTAAPQDGGEADESDWDLDMSSQVRGVLCHLSQFDTAGVGRDYCFVYWAHCQSARTCSA